MTRDDEYDAFGRPVERRDEEDAPPQAQAEPQPRFLPPTDAPPEREAWWAEPSPPAPSGWAPPSDTAPAPAPGRGPATVPGGRPAEWVERVGAAVIDGLIRFAIGLFLLLIVAFAVSGDEDATTIATFVIMWGLVPFYAPILIARWDGRTVGHKAVNTRIVGSDGARISGGRAVVREVLVKHLLIDMAGALLTLGILPLLNYLWPLWDEKNEALHDKISRTRVVKI